MQIDSTRRINRNGHETPPPMRIEPYRFGHDPYLHPRRSGSRAQAAWQAEQRRQEQARRRAERRAERPAKRAMAALRAAELVSAA